MECIFSVDVEDWYHILDVPSAPALAQWENLPSRVESNFYRLLELLSEHRVSATCFFLGWIAKRFPHLVKAAAAAGHEIASHGFSHRLVYQMAPPDFVDDALRARRILEDAAGCRVLGYRAAGFSITEKTPWFFDALIDAGYVYDSSVFPAARGHGGMRSACRRPYRFVGHRGQLVEFPATVVSAFGGGLCLFGGGYLRLFPLPLIVRMASRVLSGGLPVIFYVHPREMDPRQPRLAMNASRRFKSYVNLSSTEKKVARLLAGFRYVTFQDYLKQYFAADYSSLAASDAGPASGVTAVRAHAEVIGC